MPMHKERRPKNTESPKNTLGVAIATHRPEAKASAIEPQMTSFITLHHPGEGCLKLPVLSENNMVYIVETVKYANIAKYGAEKLGI